MPICIDDFNVSYSSLKALTILTSGDPKMYNQQSCCVVGAVVGADTRLERLSGFAMASVMVAPEGPPWHRPPALERAADLHQEAAA